MHIVFNLFPFLYKILNYTIYNYSWKPVHNYEINKINTILI